MKFAAVDQLQKNIGYEFKDIALLENALTHSSYAHENGLSYGANNERLEFLGDAVLELSSSRFIFDKYPKVPEGKMTKLRAALVCEQSLAEVARKLNFGDFIRLSNGEISTGGAKRDSILSDAVEAVIGAIYLDGGFDAADIFIKKYVLVDIDKKHMMFESKSALQELVQDKYHADTKIEYKVVEESGPAHAKHFRIACFVQGKKLSEGVGPTKKKAESMAAYEAIKIIS
ncbi:MAG: ribonuclease III [Eubacterium sp.]|nr:ribonuclease III [Eubacterium sp.]